MTQTSGGPPAEGDGWYVPLPGPDRPTPSPIPIKYFPLDAPPKGLEDEVADLVAVEFDDAGTLPEGVRALGPVVGFVVKAVASGVVYDLVKSGVGYVLETPNVNPADPPQTLYSPQTQLTYTLRDGVYVPTGNIQHS